MGKDVQEKSSLPFYEENGGDEWITRRFSSGVSPEALQWHRDGEDRTIRVVQSSGWKLQKDNCLPITLEKEKCHSICKGEWHRIIKGSGDLILQIKKH